MTIFKEFPPSLFASFSSNSVRNSLPDCFVSESEPKSPLSLQMEFLSNSPEGISETRSADDQHSASNSATSILPLIGAAQRLNDPKTTEPYRTKKCLVYT
ncbi:hypothetical protein AVEN_53720-1 [Araneus ventricosus]|uniref:Uncharacterized protein n=1 Tax=Araneus ventricosus TaxID=182803 RepID=A0A4Y2K995_ARAVE|nr:hypothetical protein AVEN_53720-1 [Araneus ventricosus]